MPFRCLLSISGLMILLLIASCQDMGIETSEGGRGIIVPGISVEGIKLGDSKETVEARLGRPTSVGWADGLYRSWRIYSYEVGVQPWLEFYFIDSGNGYGPLDAIGGGPAYRGSTREGIGIGSSLGQVRGAYGAPDTTLFWAGQNIVADFYCMNQKKLEIHYKDSAISVFSIGYFIPILDDPLNPCK